MSRVHLIKVCQRSLLIMGEGNGSGRRQVQLVVQVSDGRSQVETRFILQVRPTGLAGNRL